MPSITATVRSATRRTEVLSRSCDCLPANFDPDAHPIIAQHFFGIEPSRSAGTTGIDIIADLKRQRHIRKLHRLGDRVLDEMLTEIGDKYGIATGIERTVERYAALDPEALVLAGAPESQEARRCRDAREKSRRRFRTRDPG